MGLTPAGRDLLLSGGLNTITHLGLANAAGTEFSGGSPPYARLPVTWNAVTGFGIESNATTLVFDVGGSVGTPLTAARILLRKNLTGGTDYGWYPPGGFAPFVTTVDATTDAFTNYVHGLVDGAQVFVEPVAGAALPAPLASGTQYRVMNVSPNTFQVSVSLAALNITVSGECWVQQVVPETFNSQGKATIAAGDFTLYAPVI